jgi:hypothetical protein
VLAISEAVVQAADARQVVPDATGAWCGSIRELIWTETKPTSVHLLINGVSGLALGQWGLAGNVYSEGPQK